MVTSDPQHDLDHLRTGQIDDRGEGLLVHDRVLLRDDAIGPHGGTSSKGPQGVLAQPLLSATLSPESEGPRCRDPFPAD